MDYTKEDMAKAKGILTNLLKFFDEFCEKNGLKYYACAGTCLGAVRHKGFIPWDDDIDVVMPREDYEKLLSLRDSLKGTDYVINDISDKGYYLPYAKFCENKTTLVEHKDKPFLLGMFIDVFPLDEASDTSECRRLFKKKNRVISRYAQGLCKGHLKRIAKVNGLCAKTKCLMFFFFGWLLKFVYLKQFSSIEKRIQHLHGDHVMYYGGAYGFDKELHNKEWFGEGARVQFENISVVVPSDYKSYLTKLYGDYMTPPPPEKQISHHYHYFYDFDKRWSLEDVMKLDLEEQAPIDYKYE
jgi:lipopolysaccharide cholinephosphotransferase